MASVNFYRALEFTLSYEGGKSNHPKDPGGKTNQGITQRTYDHYRHIRGLPKKDVYEMIVPERNAIYREIWDEAGCNELPSGLDVAVFDLAVNSGVGRARKLLAESRRGGAVAADIILLCKRRMSFLERLRVWNIFRRGWTTRVRACLTFSLGLVNARG